METTWLFFLRFEVYVCCLCLLCRMKGRKFNILSVLFNWNQLLSFINPKDVAKAPLHINAFSFETAYISMRLGLPSTLIRWAFSSKTYRFENALESGSNENAYTSFQCEQSKTHRTESDDRKYLRHVSRFDVWFAWSSTYVTTCYSIVFERFSADCRNCIKTVLWTQIDRCVFDDNKKKAYFWKRSSKERA